MKPVYISIKMNKQVTKKDKKNGRDKEDVTNLNLLKQFISLSSEKNTELTSQDIMTWQPVLIDLLYLLCSNNEIGNEIVLLASSAYISLQWFLYTLDDFETSLNSYLNLQTNLIIYFKEDFKVYNIELFKLIICNGFLQLRNNITCSYGIYKTIFNIAYPHCISYTRYTYFSFKILQQWMQKISKTALWLENSWELEEKIEVVIFSNWDNTICKTNVEIFVIYLDIMKKKYNNFLIYLFYNCVQRISWCHVNKFIILSEICDKLENIELITDSKFISNLINSLINNNLVKASTKVYLKICKKLSNELWKKTFGKHLKNYINTWEAQKNYNTVEELCKCWIEPAIKNNRDILTFLVQNCDEKSILYQSHLLRIARKYGFNISLKNNEDILLNHKEAFVRLNAFAAHCYEVGNLNNVDYFKSIDAIKHFLYFNATTNITYLREGIFTYFKVLFNNLSKRVFIESNSKDIISFLEWLYEFQIYCFEIGSCYQRKIFGLHLCKISLQFLHSNNCSNTIISQERKFNSAMKYGYLLQKKLKDHGKWKFTNKETAILLFKLVLDSAIDIEKISSYIIINFFDPEVLSNTEKNTLFTIALEKCNSYKIFEINSGAYLFKILEKWFPLNEANKLNLKLKDNFNIQSSIGITQLYVIFLFEEAIRQFALIKKDILKAVMQNTPFYGVLTALLMIGFNNNLNNYCIVDKFIKEVIDMIENAVNYFVDLFSLKSSNLEYSSSFEEISLAINEAIESSEINYTFNKLQLSRAHQIIITCIWRSLKVLCELAVEIAKSKYASDSLILQMSELIATVLLKCRYKGIIEAAGVSIGNLSRFLCKSKKHVILLEDYLKKLLDKDFLKNINLTRRGAGLTIMFHKIIVNDIRIERPLLHFAIKSLILNLRESLIKVERKQVNNYDDPNAMHLHFLKSLFADKQLQSELNPYLEDTCLVCFEYISSKIFTIRNASLQLFGALVSRLVGQNTGVKSVDYGYGYSINYFVTHFPKLVTYILSYLETYCKSFFNKNDKCQNSTNIIYILTLISKMFYSGVAIIDGTSIIFVKQIKNYLCLFLSSPVAHVRHLASKAFSAIVASSSLKSEIKHLKSQIILADTFNQLNGYLNVLELLYEKQDEEFQNIMIKYTKIKSVNGIRKNLEINFKTNILWNFWSRRSVLIKKNKFSYVVEAQLLRLSRKFQIILKKNTIKLKNTNHFYTLFEKTMPGFFEFIGELMNLFMEHLYYNQDTATIKNILEAKCIDFGVHLLKQAPHYNRILFITSIEYAINNFEKSHQILLEAINIYTNESIKYICQGELIHLQYDDIHKLKIFASKLEHAFIKTIQMSELLTFIYILSLQADKTCDCFEDLMYCILKEKITLTNYFTYTEVLRESIAKSLNILLYNFDYMNDKCKVTLVLASLILLKDELFFIRQSIQDSIFNDKILIYNLSKEIMDEIICNKLLLNLVSKETILGELCDNEVIEFFEKYLSTTYQYFNAFDIEISCEDVITSFNEESKIINFITYCLQQKLSKGIFIKHRGMHNNINCDLLENNRKIIQKMNINSQNLEHILKITSSNYLTEKFKVIHEDYFKLKQ